MADDKQVRLGIQIDKTSSQQAMGTVDALRREFGSLGDATKAAGAAAQNAARITDLGWKPVRKTIQDVHDDVEDTKQSLNKISEGGTSFFRGISGLTGGALGEIAQTSRQIEEVTRGFQKMTSQGIGPLLKELGPTVIAAGALSVGIAAVTAVVDAFNKDIEEQKKQLHEELAIRQELRDLSRTATSEEAKQKRDAQAQVVEDIKTEIKYYEKRRIELLSGGFNLETLQRQEANKALLEEQQKLLITAEEKLGAYNDALNNQAFALNDQKDFIKQMTDNLTGATKVIDAIGSSTAKAADAFKELQKAEDEAFKKVQQRNTDLASAQEKYEADVANIEAQSLQKRADIQQKYNDKLVEIAAKAAQDAEDRLAKLQQTRDDLAANFAQEEASVTQKAQLARMDVEVKAQRDERDALQEHLRALEDIRRAAQQREQGFLLDRNFLGLLQSRTQTGYDIEDENRKYLNAQQGRKQAIQDQAQDTARAFEQERQVRLQAYQKQLADAQQAYNREMAAAQKARQLELVQAVTDRNKALQEEARAKAEQLAALRKQHIQELQDIYDFGARKLKAEKDYLQRSLDMIGVASNRAQVAGQWAGTKAIKPGISQFADGGAPPVGQWSMVNDRLDEQFNGTPFPGGLGMFYPLQPGYISNTNNSKRVNAPVTINVQGGQNPAETARMVKQEVVTILERVMR